MRSEDRYVAQNRRARHDYLIEDTLEAGLVLQGTEVKVLRKGQASIAEAYADESGAASCVPRQRQHPGICKARRTSTTSRAGGANYCCTARK